MKHTIALFGEAEKGEFSSLMFFQDIADLSDTLGNPPDESFGIPLAIQTLLYDRNLIYIRVKEEGFSTRDYLRGLRQLQNFSKVKSLSAICLPGVGDTQIINASANVCALHSSLLMIKERDLYDYLTNIHQTKRL